MRIVVAIVVALAMTGCADSGSDEELLVSAAASLTDVFAALEGAFEEANPGVDVVLNLAGSSRLREQILGGAPVDVFASASAVDMDHVVSAGETIGAPRLLARNRLQIAVPAGNPAGVGGLADLEEPDLLVGLCAEGVPCGDLARQALERAEVTPSIDTNEPDVRSLLTKIEAGELDVAITYTTDTASTDGAVEGVDIPNRVNVVTEYWVVVLADAREPAIATAFIDFVTSEEGQETMSEFGFGTP